MECEPDHVLLRATFRQTLKKTERACIIRPPSFPMTWSSLKNNYFNRTSLLVSKIYLF